jgi:hypothetical protein
VANANSTLWMLTSILMLTRGYSKELRDPLRHQPHATRSNRMPMSQLREPPSVQDRTAVAPWENQPGPPVLSARSFIIPDIEDDLAPPPHGDETFVPSRGSMRTHVVARGSLAEYWVGEVVRGTAVVVDLVCFEFVYAVDVVYERRAYKAPICTGALRGVKSRLAVGA